ncbi:MAG: M3 family metallopeptidase [Bacteriovoracia bacterium]
MANAIDFNAKAAREQMLELAEKPIHQELKFFGLDSANPKTKKFIEQFQSKIWPRLQRFKELSVRASALMTALDRALYNNEDEKKLWMKSKDDSSNEFQKITTSKEWQNDVKKWAQLSKGLKGELAECARRMWEDIELGEFTEKEMPMLERLTAISTEISNISNTSPIVPKLAGTEKAINDTIKDFFDKKLEFDAAWKKIESYQKESRTAHGQDTATKARDLLHEAAVIRTKLAKSKKFKTWAQYVLAQQARHYSAQFKKPEDRIRFLEKLLKATKAPYIAFLKKRTNEIKGASFKDLRMSQLSLLTLEDETLIRPYFQKERIEDEWAKAMKESGFNPDKLKTIYLDGYPRENKYTHAYMNNASDHEPKTLEISAKTLNVTSPKDESKWNPAQIYIVQNYRDDGPNAWTTAFHEGGHALDYAHRKDLLGYGAAYGYVETHSMMMERFFDDIEYLTQIGKTKDGKRLSKDLAGKYVNHSKINELVKNRTQVAYALYDLLLWNHAYLDSQKGTPDDFVGRANKIFGELIEEARQAKGAVIDDIDWRMSAFATGHFYSGEVRYFGYIVADMAAELSAKALWEKLKKKTGRKTFYKQPSLANILIAGYYEKGFLEPFPKSVEKFTGKPFSPKDYTSSMVEAIEDYGR